MIFPSLCYLLCLWSELSLFSIKFKCGCLSLFVINNDRTQIVTKAHSLQCHQHDVKDLIKLLQNTYKSDPCFVFHKTRHTSLHACKNDICKQNLDLAMSHVVPIQGISNDLMFFLDHKSFTIQAVVKIKASEEKGHFSIMTHETHFQHATSTLCNDLSMWAKYYATQNIIYISLTFSFSCFSLSAAR